MYFLIVFGQELLGEPNTAEILYTSKRITIMDITGSLWNLLILGFLMVSVYDVSQENQLMDGHPITLCECGNLHLDPEFLRLFKTFTQNVSQAAELHQNRSARYCNC